MTSELRITPSQSLEDYRVTGMRPINRHYGSERCGCPLTARYAAEHGRDAIGACSIAGWATSIYGQSYFVGFIGAVDGLDKETHSIDSRMIQGYEDGRAVWSAIERELLGKVAT